MTTETKPEALALVAAEQANALTVKDQPTFDAAGEKLKALAALKKDIKAKLDPFVEKAHEAHKAAVAERDRYLKPLDAAMGGLKNRMLAWTDAEARRRAEEARKAQEAAEAAERKRRDEEAARIAAESAKAAEEGDFDAAAAAQEEAQAIAAAPVAVAAPVIAAPIEKPKGIAIPGKHVADLADARAFVAHVLATPDLAHMVQAMALTAQSEMNERARRQGELFRMPGWTVRFQRNLSVRSA